MPKDRQLLLLLGGLFTLLMSSVVITMIIYQMTATNLHTGTVPATCRQGFATCSYLKRSGLGNIMFQYASMLGISRTRVVKTVLPPDFRLRKYFKMSAKDHYEIANTAEWRQYYEIKANAYDDFLVMKLNPCYNMTLVGYFQSFKYFEQSADEVRQAFEFHDDIKIQARDFLINAAQSAYGTAATGFELIFIGIHIRRGDMASHKAVEYGYSSAPKDYFLRAIKRYKNQFYVPMKTKLIFIITSDDIPWCEDTFEDVTATFVYSKGNPDYLDLAILGQCNHTIITSGSFSWWAGWLSTGNVTYYKGFPVPGSKLESGFSSDRSDYYPKHWRGLE